MVAANAGMHACSQSAEFCMVLALLSCAASISRSRGVMYTPENSSSMLTPFWIHYKGDRWQSVCMHYECVMLVSMGAETGGTGATD